MSVTKIPMNETQLQKVVIDRAHDLNWRVAHFRPVRVQRHDGSVHYQTPVQADGAGFPDLVLVRERVIFAELKSDTGRLEAAQMDWMFALGQADAERYIWYPDAWRSGEIESVLR